MNREQFQSALDAANALPESAREDAIWITHWIMAWTYCARHGHCDSLGSWEYRRLTALARWIPLPPSQTAMRLWIRTEANRPASYNPGKEGKPGENT